MQEYPYCYTPDEMAAFVEGNADPASLAAFENHILECAPCRREWVEIRLASHAPAEAPPTHIQETIKNAPQAVRAGVRQRALVLVRRTFSSRRRASLIAAGVVIAVVIALLTALSGPEPPDTGSEVTIEDAAPEVTPEPPEEREAVVKHKDEAPKKPEVKYYPVPEPEIKIVKEPEPPAPQSKPDVESPEPEPKFAKEPQPAPEPETPKPERLAHKEPTSPPVEEDAQPAPEPAPPEKLAVKLSRRDRRIFGKCYQVALFSVVEEERKLLEEERARIRKENEILGPRVQPTGPVAPPPTPKAPPKPDPSQTPGPNPDAPPPLPRIDELRREGKIPPADPQPEPSPEPAPEPAPKPKPKTGGGPREAPPVAPVQPRSPTRRLAVQVPAVKPEILAGVSEEIDFELVMVPKLKPHVILVRAEVIEDLDKTRVAHLFYYFGNGGFSIFERKTARTDDKHDYRSRNRFRTLMWAAGKREFILVAQKLTKKQMLAIKSAICESLK